MNTLTEFAQWLEEQTFSTSQFSIEHLKKIDSEKVDQATQVKIYRYLKKTLGESSWSGSFRYTWILDDQRVIKLIKNVDSISQNQQELQNSECLGSEFAIQVLDHHPKFYWLIEERVGQVTESQFISEFNKKLGSDFSERTMLSTGIEIDTVLMITNAIHHLVMNRKRDGYRNIYPIFEDSDWFLKLMGRLKGCQVGSQDFHHENWGVRPKTNEFILLDLGF